MLRLLNVRQHLAEVGLPHLRIGEQAGGCVAAIHGDNMPRLAELRARAGDVDVHYEPRPDGAQITFTSDDPGVVDALHQWGEAQVSDHGSHANARRARATQRGQLVEPFDGRPKS